MKRIITNALIGMGYRVTTDKTVFAKPIGFSLLIAKFNDKTDEASANLEIKLIMNNKNGEIIVWDHKNIPFDDIKLTPAETASSEKTYDKFCMGIAEAESFTGLSHINLYTYGKPFEFITGKDVEQLFNLYH